MELYLYLDYIGIYVPSIGVDAYFPTWLLLIPAAVFAWKKWRERP